jgi:hypothetical protein
VYLSAALVDGSLDPAELDALAHLRNTIFLLLMFVDESFFL